MNVNKAKAVAKELGCELWWNFRTKDWVLQFDVNNSLYFSSGSLHSMTDEKFDSMINEVRELNPKQRELLNHVVALNKTPEWKDEPISDDIHQWNDLGVFTPDELNEWVAPMPNFSGGV